MCIACITVQCLCQRRYHAGMKGVMPGAFQRPNGDYVDAWMMFKALV